MWLWWGRSHWRVVCSGSGPGTPLGLVYLSVCLRLKHRANAGAGFRNGLFFLFPRYKGAERVRCAGRSSLDSKRQRCLGCYGERVQERVRAGARDPAGRSKHGRRQYGKGGEGEANQVPGARACEARKDPHASIKYQATDTREGTSEALVIRYARISLTRPETRVQGCGRVQM